MKVRTKLALATGFGLLLMLGVFYAGGRMVVVAALRQASHSLLRALPELRHSLQSELNQLQLLARTTAASPGLRRLVALSGDRTNQWDEATLDGLGVDLLALVASDGEIRLATARRPNRGGPLDVPESGLGEYLQPESPLMVSLTKGGHETIGGLIMLSDVAMLATVAPVPASDGATPGRFDIVLLGRAVAGDAVLRRLTAGFPVESTILRPGLDDQNVDWRQARDVVGETFQIDLPALWRTDEPIRAWLPLYDVNGRTALSIRISLNRVFLGQAEVALAWLTLYVAGVGALFIVPMFLVQGRTVLNPLTRLVNDIQSLGGGVPAGRRLDWKRRDEFGVVADTIDEMLASIDREHGALGQSNERIRAVLAASPDLIIVVDRAGTLVDVATHQTGRLAKTFAGVGVGGSLRQADGLAHPVFDAFLGHIGEALDTNRVQVFEHGIKRDGDDTAWVEIRMARLAPDQALVTVRDITARRHAQRERARLEEKMAQMQKTESLGVLAGGMAHDFNNILTAMLGHVEVIAADTLSAGAREAADNMRLAMIRASTLTRQMLSYAGQGSFTFALTDLNALLKDLVRLMKRSLDPQARLVLAFGERVPLVEADATQIWQVVMNLLMNASDAMTSLSGTITLTTSHATPSVDELDAYLTTVPLLAGDYAMIEVSDTGHGMDKRTIERIYDPFFTTKALGRGLGLSACLGIVRAHNGGIRVTSQSGVGTCFRILLPAARDAAGKLMFPDAAAAPAPRADAAEPRPPPAPPRADAAETLDGAGRKILVADDDPAILRLVEIILKGRGFEVVTVDSGELALDRFKREPEAFDLVLLDLSMDGGMNGIDVCEAIHDRKPTLATIIMSGYRESVLERHLRHNLHVSYLAKPFMSTELFAAVGQALSRGEAAGSGQEGNDGTVV